jgi:predicted nuclease of predicted toxin-antitoxin system
VILFANESVDRHIVERLRQDGHAVQYVAEMEPGIPDAMVLSLATQGEGILLTADKDFGEVVIRQRRLVPGILLVRLAGLSAARKAEVVSSAVSQHSAELPGAIGVLTPGAFRVRRLK